jgi:hypothetical protein
MASRDIRRRHLSVVFRRVSATIDGRNRLRLCANRRGRSGGFSESEGTIERHKATRVSVPAFWHGPQIIVISFDDLDQGSQFVNFHGLLVDSDIHDSQDLACARKYESFERLSAKYE